MRIPSLLLLLFLPTLSYAQDEAYGNERVDNSIPMDDEIYSLSAGTNFDEISRFTFQRGRFPIDNLSYGYNFSFKMEEEDFNFIGIGMYARQYFLNGRLRLLVEPQINLQVNVGRENFEKDFYIEYGVIGGLSFIPKVQSTTVAFDLLGMYHAPFSRDINGLNNFIPALRASILY